VNARINYLLLATALLGTFFSGTATRIFNIAMPTVAASLGTDLLGISWALLAYQLSNIGFSIIFGRLADMWGRERMFALGFIVFSLGSLLCGLSQTVSQLISFRFLQGVGGAMLQSSSRALAAESVPEKLAGRAQGYMTTAHHTGFLLGPSMGGLMIDYLSWRWTFFFLVPIGFFGASLALRNVNRRPISSHRHSIDYLGGVLLFATTTTLVFLLDRRSLQFLGPEAKTLLVIVFLGALGFLILHESKTKHPFVNLAFFKNRIFTFGILSLLNMAICYTLTFFLLPFYLQNVLDLSPSVIGVLFMAPPIMTIALAPLGGYLADRFGPHLPASVGVTFMFASLLVGGLFRPDSHWLLPTFMIALGGMTNGIFNPANSMAVIGRMSAEHRGFAAAVHHVTFGFGNVLGVALGGFLMAVAFEYHTGLPGVSPSAENPAGFVAALTTTFVVAAGLSFIAVWTSLVRGGGKSRADLEEHK
jgi:EmrB/QacA subfamily drug resistance transporter